MVQGIEWAQFVDKDPPKDMALDIQLDNGSILLDVHRHPTLGDVFVWNCGVSGQEDDERLLPKSNIFGWRLHRS